jgi:hypothetical protein
MDMGQTLSFDQLLSILVATVTQLESLDSPVGRCSQSVLY